MKNGQHHAIGGRVVKWKGRVASIAPNMMSVSVVALMSMGALSSHALAETIDDAQFSEVHVTIDEDVTITSTGSIDVVGSTPDETLLQVTPPSGPYTGTIQNDGALTAFLNDETSFTGIWVEADLAGVVNNTGTISLELSNSLSDVSAWGIYTGDVSGQITNSGLIDVAVHTVSYVATAYGIHVDGIAADASVTNTNAGTINVVATADLESSVPVSASAYGIYVNDDVAGVLVNAGLISVQAIADTDSAIAYGIFVGGDVAVGGAVTNSGTITSYAKTTSDTTAYAYGIYVGGVVFGSIENSGLIAARSLSVTYDAEAYGIYVDSSVAAGGSVTNTVNGVIQVEVTSDSSATGYGIYVDDDVAGTVNNAGEIVVMARSTGSTATAYGIYVNDDVLDGGSVVNSGTIDVYAEADNSYATAYGIYVKGTVTGAITNSGDIVVEAVTSTDSSASAYGIYVGAVDVDGTITNSGTIDVYAHSITSSAEAYGIYVAYALDGTITNTASGVITASAYAPDSTAAAYGVYINGDLNGDIVNAGRIEVEAQVFGAESGSAVGIYVYGDLIGTINNSGDITATALGTNSSANAYGIYIDSDLAENGLINNSGTIAAIADNNSSNASAFGIYVNGQMSGTIENSTGGTISATATADNHWGSAYAIYASEGVSESGVIENSGTISATAVSTNVDNTYDPYAYGIYANGQISGLIDNSGIISATATSATDGAGAYGILVDGMGVVSGEINNSGDITATATAVESSVTAYGIYVSGGVAGIGAINNSGTITATATTHSTDYSAEAYGIGVDNGVAENGVINNSGTITATAMNDDSSATAYGINVGGSMDGTITNTGKIEIFADATNSSATAYGVHVGTVGSTGIVTNSGSISVVATSGTSDSQAYGVYLGDMAGHFTNTGSIIASEDGHVGTAIYIAGHVINNIPHNNNINNNDSISGALVTLNTGGFIEGDIVLSGPLSLNVQGDVGRSVHWTVDEGGENGVIDYTNNDGDFGTTVFQDNNGSTVQFATLDSSGLAAVRQAGADAGFIGLDALLSKTSNAAVNPAQVTSGHSGGNTFMPYVAAASKSVTYGGGDTMLDQHVATSSLNFGGTTAMDSGMSFGLGAGATSGTATVDYMGDPSSETDQTGAFVGVAMGASAGNLNFAGAISGGRIQFDNTRYVNDNTEVGGIATYEGTFDSTFIAAELGVSGRFSLGNGLSLLPNSTVRYAQHKVDGYTETGTGGAEADVAAQSFGVLEGEVGVTLEKTVGAGVFSGGISLMSHGVTGGEDVMVTMIGDDQFVDTTIGSSTATKLSLGYSSNFSAAGQFNLGFETLVGSTGMSGGKISGEIRFSF